ncbi:murein biosynthesis integral membrane protein MurJ [Paraclostridium bifermentans]|uniref:murein biosynthesis integral membrane protein MurJ n=1 Tax=Paraclostridium bifermentans TaxID=1490 RepID=UPI00359C1C9E
MSKVAKNTILIMILGIVCKVLGFGRDIVLGSLYGLGGYGGIYVSVISIPNITFAMISSCIMTTFIPMHYEIKNNCGIKRSDEFLNNVFNITIIVSLIVALFGIFFTEPIVKIFAMGLQGSEFDIAVKFTKILMIGGFFTGIAGIMTAYLNINGEFTIPSIVSIPYNIIVIIAMYISVKTSPYIMVIGTSIGVISTFIVQLIAAYKKGYRYRFKINLKDEYLIKMLILASPILIGVAVNQVNAAVDKSMATDFGIESAAALGYASKLNGFIMGIFIASLASVIYPKLSELLIDDNKEGFVSIITKSINLIIIFIIPISAGAIILSNPIVSMLFESGKFDSEATKMTALALSGYSLGMIAYSLRDILSKIFYSLKDTKTPMINGIVAVALNIIMDIYFSRKFGYVGLTFATSLSSIICVISLFIGLHKKAGYFGQDKIIKTLLKSLISVVVMSLAVLFVYNNIVNIFNLTVIPLSIAVFVGGLLYLGLMFILRVDELDIILDLTKKIITNLKIKILKNKAEQNI